MRGVVGVRADGESESYVHGASFSTRAVTANGSTPQWSEACDVLVSDPADAIVTIHVYDRVRTSTDASLIGYQASRA